MTCNHPEIDPDDWFISRDGKQYPSDRFLTDEEETRIAKAVLVRQGETDAEHAERVASAIRAAAADRRRAALGRRRRAKETCLRDCPVDTRLQCIEYALDNGIRHGTWGGLYEEEIHELRRRRGLPTA